MSVKSSIKGFLPFLLVMGFGPWALMAQEDLKPQVHGFVTQGFVYSGGNNYLGMDTNSGSAGWTEGAVNINDQLTHRLRVGAQFHSTKLGQFGSWVPGVDWALADYRVNQWLGIRAGKVKIRWGLFNDTQDADPGYLWSLLPEPMYAVDWRTTNLSQLGAELYGRVRLGAGRGELGYSVYYGHYSYASNDGYMEGFKQSGIDFSKRPGASRDSICAGRHRLRDWRWADPSCCITPRAIWWTEHFANRLPSGQRIMCNTACGSFSCQGST